MQVEEINYFIKNNKVDTNLVSDGYHTFGELYEHRIVNFMTICKLVYNSFNNIPTWMSKKHSDGSEWKGWFILGIYTDKGKQITYHLPIEKWDECCMFALTLDKAPEFDGHTSQDVLERLKQLELCN